MKNKSPLSIKEFNSLLKQCPAIAILRGLKVSDTEAVCEALLSGGIKIIEITMNTPGALECIKNARNFIEPEIPVGAGTVLTVDEVEAVYDAGGSFIISPNGDEAVIKKTKALGMISIPGVLTPTEALAAVKAGADYLKLFPACTGVNYIKSLKAVIETPFIATGGVNLSNVLEYCSCCVGAGIGSSIFKPGKSVDEINRDASEFSRILKSARKENTE